MKAMLALLTAGVLVIAAVAVYAVFIRDPERDKAESYFSHYLDTCDEAEADQSNLSLNEQLATPPDFECDRSVDELLDMWEDENRPKPSEIAAHPTPR
ncbi:hypothetical protein [Nocardioides sp. 503]|uniref:hypothetical protein n=1 Tax=Nocardioides sp. 503 TaxID=2508326 RepID=UPI00106FE3FD|nr:hypothetical protein [Nocardioides sp. 503]